MSNALQILTDLLELKEIEPLTFVGPSYDPGWRRIYGGQVIAQAIKAAALTEKVRDCHSIHAYFLRAGDPSKPVTYKVDAVRDGKSFNTRMVYASQDDEVIFTMGASFHKTEPGFDHQEDIEDIPRPDELPTVKQAIAMFGDDIPAPALHYFSKERPFELRPTDLTRYQASSRGEKRPASQDFWMRAISSLGDDPGDHRAALGFASDFTLLDTALIAHGKLIFEPNLMMASLDHAIWFHRPFRADDWLLYRQTSPTGFGARALCFGRFYDLSGRLIASTAQEGLIRQTNPDRKSD